MFTVNDAKYPMIYINHFNYFEVDELLKEKMTGYFIKEYDYSRGNVSFNQKDKESYDHDQLDEFLEDCRYFIEQEDRGIILLKDFHFIFSGNYIQPRIIGILRMLAQEIEKHTLRKKEYSTKIVFVSTKLEIPEELKPFIGIKEFPIPDVKEIHQILKNFMKSNRYTIEDSLLHTLPSCFLGLSRIDIKRVIHSYYSFHQQIDENIKDEIQQTRKDNIKKTGVLELIDVPENLKVAGLSELQYWLRKKAKIFQDYDFENKKPFYRIQRPKGVLIVGVPGSGKSHTAKLTSTLFNCPLIRFDVGSLLGKYVGESEYNMRNALKLAEENSPCILWIDEIEKAFSNIGGGNGHETTVRIFGYFLTWMQEHKSKVFIIATANDISNLPPEFLRKGRFDEIFVLNLPLFYERKQLFEMQFEHVQHLVSKVDITKLAQKTEGFTSSDIPNIVSDMFEQAYYLDKKQLLTDDFIEAIESFPSFSRVMTSKIDEMQDKLKTIGSRNASSSSQAMNVIHKIEKVASYKNGNSQYGRDRTILFGNNKNCMHYSLGSADFITLKLKNDQLNAQVTHSKNSAYKELRKLQKTKDHAQYVATVFNGTISWEQSLNTDATFLSSEKSDFSLITQNGQKLACIQENKVILQDLKNKKTDHRIVQLQEDIVEAAFNESGTLLACAHETGTIHIIDVAKNKCIQTLEGHSKRITKLIFTKDTLISSSKDFTVKVWKKQQKDYSCKTIFESDCAVTDVVVNTQFEFIIFANTKGKIYIYDFANFMLLQILEHQEAIESIALSDDELRFAIIDRQLQVHVWDIHINKGVME